MGEVAEMFDVNPSLIRFWEKRFSVLKPKKNAKGNRLFTNADIENLKLIHHLVKERGMTLAGAEKHLKENKHISPASDSGQRDLQLLERLQNIRAALLEIKAELGAEDSDSEIIIREQETVVAEEMVAGLPETAVPEAIKETLILTDAPETTREMPVAAPAAPETSAVAAVPDFPEDVALRTSNAIAGDTATENPVNEPAEPGAAASGDAPDPQEKPRFLEPTLFDL